MHKADQLAENAKVLAKLAKTIDKAERRNWNIGPYDEFKVERYFAVKANRGHSK